MKSIVLSCNTIRAEVDQTIEKTGCEYPVIYLESGLHNDPKILREAMQEVLNRISNVDQVLVVMGFCGNAVVGLTAKGYRMIIPRADDCITMLLGSMKVRKEVQREKATYFLSKGWIDMFDDVEKTMVNELHRMERRYGKERAERIFRASFKHYQRLGIVDTKTFDIEDMIEKSKGKSQLMQLPIEIVPGTMSFLEKFLTGPWDTDEFILIEDGKTVLLENTLSN